MLENCRTYKMNYYFYCEYKTKTGLLKSFLYSSLSALWICDNRCTTTRDIIIFFIPHILLARQNLVPTLPTLQLGRRPVTNRTHHRLVVFSSIWRWLKGHNLRQFIATSSCKMFLNCYATTYLNIVGDDIITALLWGSWMSVQKFMAISSLRMLLHIIPSHMLTEAQNNQRDE